MKHKISITQSECESLFEYRGGRLYWKSDVAKNVKAGDEAGSGDCHLGKYKTVTINKKPHQLHRVIYLMHHGNLPTVVDHINGNTFDNRIENLREATYTQNAMNRKTPTSNTSGVKGVSRRKNGLWRVFIRKGNGKSLDLSMKDFELAELVATEARALFHGKYANHGVTA